MNSLIQASTLSRKHTGPELEDNQSWPLLSIGFRPFFLVATIIAVLWVPLWLFALAGRNLGSYFPPVTLHAHEMLFGFTSAVIAGFLLTAGANWTQRKTTSALGLSLLLVLFILGRALLLTPGIPPVLVAVVDLAFFPTLTIALAIPIFQAGSMRNVPFLGMLASLFVANALMHLDAYYLRSFGVSPLSPGLGQNLALLVITLMMVVMGGRVIPLFTRNATKASGIASVEVVDRIALAAFVLAALLELSGIGVTSPETVSVVAAAWLLAGALHLFRMRTWGTRHAKAPLLWILHAGYGAIALSFVLRGLAHLGLVPHSSGLHLLTVGGIGGLCLGMMSRVSLGHSGRMLIVPKTISAAFFLLVVAALIRVTIPAIFPSHSILGYQISGGFWTLAFLLLLSFGLPIWLSPRADRGPGPS